VLYIVQSKCQDIANPLDDHSVGGTRARNFDWFGGHNYTVYTGLSACQPVPLRGVRDFKGRRS
jgi:hypothetical protein